MNVDFPKLGMSIAICLLTGFAGSYFTFISIPTWYASLAKPWFNPPNWVFGPVWTLLYLLMGVSLYLVWSQKRTAAHKTALMAFGLQLALNFLWSFAFFGARSASLGLAVIIPLWVMIAVTIRLFWPLSRNASLLLVPYFAWVSFASLLNYFVWLLNP